MRLIEDTPERRVFEQRGAETEDCRPPGSYNDEGVTIAVLAAVIGLVAASWSHSGFQQLQQGNIEDRMLLVTLISTLVFLSCVSGIVIFVWRRISSSRKRVIRYVFDLNKNTLSIEYDIDLTDSSVIISSNDYRSFVAKFAPPCYRLTLSGSYNYGIYSRDKPPPPEFIDALTMIGLKQVDKIPGRSAIEAE
jgi:hypothetical protein